jgi:hypothetical protein
MKSCFLSTVLLIFLIPGFCQSIAEKNTVFCGVVEPYERALLKYQPRSAFPNGVVSVLIQKPAKFMAWDKFVLSHKIDSYCSLFQLYVLRDSASFIDTAFIGALNKDTKFYEGWRVELDKPKNNLQLWERVEILVDALPVTAIFKFPIISDGRYDVDVLIMAQEWEMKTDITKMDKYAKLLALLIYDAIIDRDVVHFNNIIIRTFDKTVIHEMSYNINTDNMFKNFYSK